MTDEDGTAGSPNCEPTVSEESMTELVDRPIDEELQLFSALANETRLRILRIVDAADGEVCGCDLRPHLDVGQSSISQSMSRLREAGLLTRRKDGRWRYYDTTPKAAQLLGAVEPEPPTIG